MRSSKGKLMCMLLLAFFMLCFNVIADPQPVWAEKEKHVIVIDPGHSGTEEGAWAEHDGVVYKEEIINWKIANYLLQELVKYPNLDVYLTRNVYNMDMSIYDRVKVASNYNADLLVSVHNDYSDNPEARGTSILISNGNYRPYLAERERAFASYLKTEFQSIGSVWRGCFLRNSENGSLYPNNEIRDYYGIVANSVEMNVPGVIVEHCFISNEADVKGFLNSEAKLQRLAKADANAILKYCQNYEPLEMKQGWQLENGCYYYYEDGVKVKDQFLKLSDGTYYVDSTGKRVTGWLIKNGKTFFFTSDGKQVFGWFSYKTRKYYFSVLDGAMFQDILHRSSSSGILRYFDKNGVMAANRWVVLDGKTYCFRSDGSGLIGWQIINGNRYYFDKNGVMFRNVLNTSADGVLRYFDASGIMAVNKFASVNGKTYYFDQNGAAVSGWLTLNDKTYFFGKDKVMFQDIMVKAASGIIRYFGPDGVQAKNRWVEYRGNKYYFDRSGAAYKGWHKIYGKGYYFYTGTGIMARNCTLVSATTGIASVYDNDGVCIRQYPVS